MATYQVITDSESALGFRLAGVDTFVAEDVASAEKLLQQVVNEGTAGLVLINQNFMDHFSDSFQKKIERLSMPLIIPVPISKTWWREEQGEGYIFRLIRRAIGYQMKIKRA